MLNTRLNLLAPLIAGIVFGYGFANANFVHETWRAQLAFVAFAPILLLWFQRFIAERVIDRLSTDAQKKEYHWMETLPYVLFLVPYQQIFGWNYSLPFTVLLAMIFCVLQAILIAAHIGSAQRQAVLRSEKYIAVLFLISGFSALIYQVVWQRVLFSTFGINSEAVTVIVSVFMFGLGVGALVGGFLQKKFNHILLPLFVGLELLIGIFGFFSLEVINFVSHHAKSSSASELLLTTYIILAIPTMLMGATLPILVAYLQKFFHNLGKTVGLLYAFNTIGSAIAAFCTVKVLFVVFGQQTSVMVAAVCNIITALLIFDASRRLSASGADTPKSKAEVQIPSLPYAFVFIGLMAIGYISLSQEIVWFRLLGFLSGGKPQVFGLLLTAFLIGIAIGSLRSKKICESGRDPYNYLVRAIIFAVIIFYLAVPSIAYTSAVIGKDAASNLGYFLIGLLAYYTGGMLPMLIHIGAGKYEKNSTQAMSWLYFANILGATFGPLLTGFYLLDLYSMEGNVVILSGLTILLLLGILAVIPKSITYKMRTISMVGGLCLLAWGSHESLYERHLEKIQFNNLVSEPFRYILENRAGIITVEKNNPDIIFGGGIYDGRFNTSPILNKNLVDRAYMVAAMHRKPTRMLEIGLSSGSWGKIFVDYEAIQHISIVEINKGYPEVIKRYPEISPVLQSPKVKLYFDDGRRWLRNHPDEKFDFIVMNSTYHWRSNSTNLLSREFLQLAKQNLTPQGVIYYTTTGSQDIVRTAAEVFKYVTVFRNFVAASDVPFNLSELERRNNFMLFKQADGSPLFTKDAAHVKKMEQLIHAELPALQESVKKDKALHVITDDNMLTEYKAVVMD